MAQIDDLVSAYGKIRRGPDPEKFTSDFIRSISTTRTVFNYHLAILTTVSAVSTLLVFAIFLTGYVRLQPTSAQNSPSSPSPNYSAFPLPSKKNAPSFRPPPSPQPATVTLQTPTAARIIPPVLKKTSYRLAVFGDSMIDTMGDHLPYLSSSLKAKYPTANFELYNYGVGAENVASGLARFDQGYNYKSRHYPAIPQINADVIILGSFAYNPFSPYDRNLHWITLSQLVQKAQQTAAQVYLLAEIAPLKDGFGQGPNGVNWPAPLAFLQATEISEQLENAVGLAQALNVPLINAYWSTKTAANSGSHFYTNSNDGIHPSATGQSLTANLIASTIRLE